MPFNGAGLFTQLHNWLTDKANAVLVTASRFQTTYDDMAEGLTNCVTRDGQSPALADIPMGGFKLTGLADGVAADDAVTLGQAQVIVGGAASAILVFTSAPLVLTASSTYKKVPLDTVSIDLLGEFNVVLNRFTATTAGLYYVAWYAERQQTAAGISGAVSSYITKNGGSTGLDTGNSFNDGVSKGAFGLCRAHGFGLMQLAINDYVEMSYFDNRAGSLSAAISLFKM